MKLFSFLFGKNPNQTEEYLNNGAVILDVRSQREWDNGHIDTSIHMPLNEIEQRIDEVKHLDKPIITCCQSGIRSAKAAKFLSQNNIDAINGGGWINLNKKL